MICVTLMQVDFNSYLKTDFQSGTGTVPGIHVTSM